MYFKYIALLEAVYCITNVLKERFTFLFFYKFFIYNMIPITYVTFCVPAKYIE